MRKVVILDGLRTPIGKFGGSLSSVGALEFSSQVLKKLLMKNNITKIDELIVGNVLSAGLGQNLARQILLKSKLSEEIPAFTLNKVCGSGLKAVELAFNSIKSGTNDIVVVGGVEDMSNAPYLLSSKVRFNGLKFGEFKMQDSIERDGLLDALTNTVMGLTAENLAEKYNISREEQDLFAFNSHQKAIRAVDSNFFDDEICPIEIVNQKNKQISFFKADEQIRRDLSIEKMANLKPIFKENGTVTVGNSSSINDGAAFLIIVSHEKALELGIEPLVFIEGFKSVGLNPLEMGFGAFLALEAVIEKFNVNEREIDLIETNEAFSAQALSVIRSLSLKYKIQEERVNVNGGAIALGHPLAMSGSRILLSLARNLKMQNKNKGLCSLCIGGGMGISCYITRN